MADVGFEGEHFEDHVQDADEDGGAEEVDVSVEENFLDHFKLASVAAGG